MKHMMGLALCLLMLLSAAMADGQRPDENQPGAAYFRKRPNEEKITTVDFGGSARDWLYDMAVSDDGLIAMTGCTESSDGTLASRTKTGLSGWLLVIDSEGSEVFSFCTRLGNHDNLTSPVFHDDGTLTVMLFAENMEWVKLELIRLDRTGRVLSRQVLRELSADSKSHIAIADNAHDARGYILRESLTTNTESYRHYFLYDYDGRNLGQQETWAHGLNAIAQRHVIRSNGPDGETYGLYRREEDGSEAYLCDVFTVRKDNLREKMYAGFISLPDGGAAGAGWVLEKTETSEERPGFFTRWDAQGHIVSEMITPGVQFSALAELPGGGFAAVGYSTDDGGDGLAELEETCALYWMNEHGVITRTVPLGRCRDIGPDCPIGVLGNGTVVTVRVTPENNDDAVVTIVSP